MVTTGNLKIKHNPEHSFMTVLIILRSLQTVKQTLILMSAYF